MRTWMWAVVGVVVVVLAAIPLWIVLDDGGDRRSAALTTGQTAAAGDWALILDGGPSMWVKSAAGCEVQANVVEEQIGDWNDWDKRLGEVGAPVCKVDVGLSARPLFDWFNQTVATQNPEPRQVDLVLRDPQTGAAKHHARLQNAVVSKLELPRLTGSAGQFATFTLLPERIQKVTPEGFPTISEGSIRPIASSTLSLNLGGVGLSAAFGSVTPPTIERKFVDVGEGGVRQLAPGRLELGDLIVHPLVGVTTTKSSGSEFLSALDERLVGVLDGNQWEPGATLIVKDGLGSRQLELQMPNVGLYGGDMVPQADNTRRFGFYVEQVTLTCC